MLDAFLEGEIEDPDLLECFFLEALYCSLGACLLDFGRVRFDECIKRIASLPSAELDGVWARPGELPGRSPVACLPVSLPTHPAAAAQGTGAAAHPHPRAGLRRSLPGPAALAPGAVCVQRVRGLPPASLCGGGGGCRKFSRKLLPWTVACAHCKPVPGRWCDSTSVTQVVWAVASCSSAPDPVRLPLRSRPEEVGPVEQAGPRVCALPREEVHRDPG